MQIAQNTKTRKASVCILVILTPSDRDRPSVSIRQDDWFDKQKMGRSAIRTRTRNPEKGNVAVAGVINET